MIKSKLLITDSTRKCASSLIGPWSVHHDLFTALWSAAERVGVKADDGIETDSDRDDGFQRVGSTAIVSLHGPMTKHDHSFTASVGGSSTLRARRQIRNAVVDDAVQTILLHIESPGGTVAGTSDLVDDIVSAKKSKSVIAHIDDIGASAAYWVASQADSVFANRTAMVGSIGTFAVVEDRSKQFDDAGIKVHLVKAGEHKGDFTGGLPVTDEQLDELQRKVNSLNESFISDVSSGRGISVESVRVLADGRVHIGADAQRLGLIDGVNTLDETLQMIAIEQERSTMDAIDLFKQDHPDQYKAIESSLVKSGEESGRKLAIDEDRKRCQDLATAFADRPTFVIEQIIKGNTVADAKRDLADVLIVENKLQAEKIASLQSKKVDVDGSSEDGVSFVPSSLVKNEDEVSKPDSSDPKALAEWEWDNAPKLVAPLKAMGWDKKKYVSNRAKRLEGKHSRFGRSGDITLI